MTATLGKPESPYESSGALEPSALGPNYARSLELGALYRATPIEIERWAVRMAGPHLDVEDIVHEVFIAHRGLRNFRGDAKVTTWLYRITDRLVRRQLRKQRLRRSVHGLSTDYAIDIPSDRPTPSEELEKRQTSAIVYAALDGLNAKYRSVVILYELEGLSGEEIAELAGIKLATVWVRLHRGRAKFPRKNAADEGARIMKYPANPPRWATSNDPQDPEQAAASSLLRASLQPASSTRLLGRASSVV